MPTQNKSSMSPEQHYEVASLVLGILSVFVPIVGIVLGVLAIVFWHKQKSISPSSMATAGMICGIVGIAWSFIVGLYILLLIFLLMAGFATTPVA